MSAVPFNIQCNTTIVPCTHPSLVSNVQWLDGSEHAVAIAVTSDWIWARLDIAMVFTEQSASRTAYAVHKIALGALAAMVLQLQMTERNCEAQKLHQSSCITHPIWYCSLPPRRGIS